jgi:hypothetical protein
MKSTSFLTGHIIRSESARVKCKKRGREKGEKFTNENENK